MRTLQWWCNCHPSGHQGEESSGGGGGGIDRNNSDQFRGCGGGCGYQSCEGSFGTECWACSHAVREGGKNENSGQDSPPD